MQLFSHTMLRVAGSNPAPVEVLRELYFFRPIKTGLTDPFLPHDKNMLKWSNDKKNSQLITENVLIDNLTEKWDLF